MLYIKKMHCLRRGYTLVKDQDLETATVTMI